MATPGLSVVIPSKNGASRLVETLAAIAGQRVGCDVETVVADDGSTDGTSDCVRGFRSRRGAVTLVRHETPRGRAAACNTGIAAAAAGVVVILDDDMTLQPGSLEAHRQFHEGGEGGAIGRILLAPPEKETCFTRFLEREEENRERILSAHRDDVPFAQCLTGHFSARREVLLSAGGFETSITRYGFEDIELASRLSGAGVRLAYLPEALAVHRAYMTDLARTLDRHYEAGFVARQLAGRTPSGPLRDYLRVDGPARLGVGADPAGLVMLRLSNRLMLHAGVRRVLAAAPVRGLLRVALGTCESIGPERLAHFGYHVARDLAYFRGYFGEPK